MASPYEAISRRSFTHNFCICVSVSPPPQQATVRRRNATAKYQKKILQRLQQRVAAASDVLSPMSSPTVEADL
nr:hypothetical protein Iba_scaffold17621CG0010 [Ipomoea batatas]